MAAEISRPDLVEKLARNEAQTNRIFNRAVSTSMCVIGMLILAVGIGMVIFGSMLYFASEDGQHNPLRWLHNASNETQRRLSAWQHRLIHTNLRTQSVYHLVVLILGMTISLCGMVNIQGGLCQQRAAIVFCFLLFTLASITLVIVVSTYTTVLGTLREGNCRDLSMLFDEISEESVLFEIASTFGCCGSESAEEWSAKTLVYKCCSNNGNCSHDLGFVDHNRLLQGCCDSLTQQLLPWSIQFSSFGATITLAAVFTCLLHGSLIYTFTEIDAEFRYLKRILRSAVKQIQDLR